MFVMLVKDRVKNKEEFTPTESMIADYILTHTREVIEYPLEDLAATLYVSKSTIIRFCKKLGFRGHKELCVQLAKEMNTFLVNNETVTGSAPFGRNETATSIAQKILTLNYQALTDTYNDLDPSRLEDIVNLLLTHKKIWFYAQKTDYLVMLDFADKLKRIGLDVHYASVPGEQMENCAVQTVESVAVLFSYEPNDEYLYKISCILQKRMIPMVVITGPGKGNLYKNATEVVHTAFTEEKPKVGTMGSRTGMFLITDILYSMMFEKNYDANLQQILEIEDALKMK